MQRRIDWAKLIVIGAMCMAQTFPYILCTTTIPSLLRTQNLELEKFWIFSLLTVPAWIKFLWAPIVDAHGIRSFGLRKTWIAFCTFLGASSLLILTAFELSPAMLIPIVGVLFLHMMIMQTQDIAVDAYTLENLSPKERGVGASVKVLFEALGDALAMGGSMYVYTRWVPSEASSGWVPMVLVSAGLLICFTLPVLIRREPAVSHESDTASAPRPSLKGFLLRRENSFTIPLLLAGGFVNFMAPALIGVLLIDHGFDLLQVGVILGLVTPIGAPLGAIFAGIMVTSLGIRAVLWILVAFTSVFFTIAAVTMTVKFPADLIFFLGDTEMARTVLAIVVLIPCIAAIAQTHMIFTVLRMQWASRTQAGTDFSSQGAIYNIGRTAAAAVSPLIAAAVGWTAFWGILGSAIVCLCLVLLGVLPLLNEMVEQRHQNEEGRSNDSRQIRRPVQLEDEAEDRSGGTAKAIALD